MSEEEKPVSIACVARSKKNGPVIMEVIGEKGVKVGEYVDTGDKKLPYFLIQGRAQI